MYEPVSPFFGNFLYKRLGILKVVKTGIFTGLLTCQMEIKYIITYVLKLENAMPFVHCTWCVFRLDRWLAAAVDCLEYFPDEQIVMLSQQLPRSNGENLDLYKKMLFEVIAKYYSQEKDPFIEGRMVTILLGVIELLGENHWLIL